MRPQLQEAKASKKDAEVVASFQLYKLEEPFALFCVCFSGACKHEKNNLTTVKKRKEKTVTPESEEKRSVTITFPASASASGASLPIREINFLHFGGSRRPENPHDHSILFIIEAEPFPSRRRRENILIVKEIGWCEESATPRG